MAAIGAPEVPPTPELLERRHAVADLGSALRALVAAAVASEVPANVLREVAARAREMTADLAASSRRVGEPSSVDDLRRGQRFFNPVVGQGSPVSLPMSVEYVDGAAVGRCVVGLAHEGPLGFCHGGVSALLLDQIMGYATAAAGHPGVTGRLQVRYRAAVPLGRALLLHGRVGDVLGVRVAVRGTIALADAPDDALVEAEGRFLMLRPEQARRLFRRHHPR
jgi:acyl-coenzyme A thioesterase PaaI-like protein